MGVNKNFVVNDGNFPGVQVDDIIIGVSVAAGATLAVGTPILRDITQLYGGPWSTFDAAIQPSKKFFYSRVTDRGVLATGTTPGDVIGVFQGVGGQGVPYTNTGSSSAVYFAQCRIQGVGYVLAGAVAAGTAVTVGSKLVTTSSNVFATVGTRAIGTSVGVVVAYPVFTTVAANISAGASTVTPASMTGIIVGSQLTIDTGVNQEIVAVTAIAATTFTATFAQTHTGPVAVAGISGTSGNALIPVPGSGSNFATIIADINVQA